MNLQDFNKSTLNIFMNEPIISYKQLGFVFKGLMSSFSKSEHEK